MLTLEIILVRSPFPRNKLRGFLLKGKKTLSAFLMHTPP